MLNQRNCSASQGKHSYFHLLKSNNSSFAQVPGQFAFSFKSKSMIMDKAVSLDRQLSKKVNLNHFFREFTFGDEKTRERVTARFSDYPDHTKFDMVGNKYQTSLKESQ